MTTLSQRHVRLPQCRCLVGEFPLCSNLSCLEAKKFRVTRMGPASYPLRVGDAHRELDFSIYHIHARESYPCGRSPRNRRKGCICCKVGKAQKHIKMFKEELSLREKFRILPPFAPPLNSYYLCEMRQMAQLLQALGSSAVGMDRGSDPYSVRASALTFSGCVHLVSGACLSQ